MAKILAFTRVNESITEYSFFSKRLAPVSFETDIESLSEIQDQYTKETFLCHIQGLLSHLAKENAQAVQNSLVHDVECEHHLSPCVTCITQHHSQPLYLNVTYVGLQYNVKFCLNLDAHLASALWKELVSSATFRRGFMHHLLHSHQPKTHLMIGRLTRLHLNSFLNHILLLDKVVEINVIYPTQKIVYLWCNLLLKQVATRVHLEEALYWLSTLGGGYSSLGDGSTFHAMQAGAIALKQLKLAVSIGDPILAAKCHLYIAQSLIQLGHTQASKKKLRSIHKFCQSLVVPDEKLFALYRSVRNRLKWAPLLSKTNGFPSPSH